MFSNYMRRHAGKGANPQAKEPQEEAFVDRPPPPDALLASPTMMNPTHPYMPPSGEVAACGDPLSPFLHGLPSVESSLEGFPHDRVESLPLHPSSFTLQTGADWIPGSFRPFDQPSGPLNDTRGQERRPQGTRDLGGMVPSACDGITELGSYRPMDRPGGLGDSFEPRGASGGGPRSVRFFSWIKERIRGDRHEKGLPEGSFVDEMQGFGPLSLGIDHPSPTKGSIRPVDPELPMIVSPNGAHPYGTKDTMPRIEEGFEKENSPLLGEKIHDTGKSQMKKKSAKQKHFESRAKRRNQLENAGEPTEEMLAVRDKLIRNKKELLPYKVFKSLPFEASEHYPSTPNRERPCSQGVFREEVDRWIRSVQLYNAQAAQRYHG